MTTINLLREIYRSDDGNIGIGISIPLEKLDINGNVNISSNLVLNGTITTNDNSINVGIGTVIAGTFIGSVSGIADTALYASNIVGSPSVTLDMATANLFVGDLAGTANSSVVASNIAGSPSVTLDTATANLFVGNLAGTANSSAVASNALGLIANSNLDITVRNINSADIFGTSGTIWGSFSFSNYTRSEPTVTVSQSLPGFAVADFYDVGTSETVPALRIANGGNIGIGTSTPNARLHIAGATGSVPPMLFAAGSILPDPMAGSIEYDGSAFYMTPSSNMRGVTRNEQMVITNSPYTLANQTAPQKIFDVGTSGAVLVHEGTHQFECFYSMVGMGTTSFGFALGGTATVQSQGWWSIAQKTTTPSLSTPALPEITYNTGSNEMLVSAADGTSAYAFVKGFVKTSTAGTIMPQVSLGIGTTLAAVGANSYFKIATVSGSHNANITIGNWV